MKIVYGEHSPNAAFETLSTLRDYMAGVAPLDPKSTTPGSRPESGDYYIGRVFWDAEDEMRLELVSPVDGNVVTVDPLCVSLEVY